MEKFAFYLPQFHRCSKNDEFWEKGFTDWITTSRAKPLFNGHQQPKLPGELGYYNLESKKVIEKQAKLAKQYNVDGFAIYHYIFDKDVVALEAPIKILRDNLDIDIGYFICWANQNWTKSWVGDNDTVLYEQKYSEEMYDFLLNDAEVYFSDERYKKINGKPVFFIHSPRSFDVRSFISKANKYYMNKGYPGVTWMAPFSHTHPSQRGLFDYLTGYPLGDSKISFMKKFPYLHGLMKKIVPNKLLKIEFLYKYLNVYCYSQYSKHYLQYSTNVSKKFRNYIPTLITNWDNTPRYGFKGFILKGSTPKKASNLLKGLVKIANNNKAPFVLIKAWNEWAEGNVIEPCHKYKRQFLEEISKIK